MLQLFYFYTMLQFAAPHVGLIFMQYSGRLHLFKLLLYCTTMTMSTYATHAKPRQLSMHDRCIVDVTTSTVCL